MDATCLVTGGMICPCPLSEDGDGKLITCDKLQLIEVLEVRPEIRNLTITVEDDD